MSNNNFELDLVIDQIQKNYFDYQQLEKIFNDLLHKKLRKHEISKVLELWVPDTNIEFGMLSLIDSIKSSNINNFKIKVPNYYLENNMIASLIKKTGYIDNYKIEKFDENNSDITFIIKNTSEIKDENDGEIINFVNEKNISKDFHIPEIKFTFKLKKIPKKNIDDFLDYDTKFETPLIERFQNIKFLNNQSSDFNYSTKIDNASFSVLLDEDGIIRNCSHSDFKNKYQVSILDLFSSNIVNTPIQEAYEHGILFTIENLIKENFLDHQKGITLPNNSGSLFLLPKYLLHQIFEKYLSNKKKDIDINFFYRKSSKKWNNIDYDSKLDLVEKTIKATLQSSNYNQSDLHLHNISKNRNGEYTRCTVIFSENISYNEKPHLLRKLELNLKRHVDSKLEVFAAAAKDTSPLRRLS